jgi:hypothetical protein
MVPQVVLVPVIAHSPMATTDKVDKAARPKIKATRPRAMVTRLRVLLRVKDTHPRDIHPKVLLKVKVTRNNNHTVAPPHL